MQGVIFLGFAQGPILDAIQTWKCNLEGRDVSFFLVSVKQSWQAVCILDGTEQRCILGGTRQAVFP